MGNRAVITASKSTNVADSTDLGLYIHWNGGRDSVEGFCAYCAIKGFTSPAIDAETGLRALKHIAQLIVKTSTIEIKSCCNLDCDNWDNGVYIIDENWQIIGRQYFEGREQNEYDLEEFVTYLDSLQPEEEQFGADKVHILLDELSEKRAAAKRDTDEEKAIMEATRFVIEQNSTRNEDGNIVINSNNLDTIKDEILQMVKDVLTDHESKNR